LDVEVALLGLFVLAFYAIGNPVSDIMLQVTITILDNHLAQTSTGWFPLNRMEIISAALFADALTWLHRV
jgi:hypothetical protein